MEGRGNGGRIEIGGNHLRIQGGATVSSEAIGFGKGSDITIAVNDLQITGTSPGRDRFPSEISTSVQLNEFVPGSGVGDGGTITITSDQISVTAGGQIRSSTFAQGDAGGITIDAASIDLMDQQNQNTGIFANG